MQVRRTRWYQSLTLRLLALFWILLLLAAAAAFSVALYLVRPPEPEPLDSEFERVLQPVLAASSDANLFQPGRLLAGEYRIVARLEPATERYLFAQGLSQEILQHAANLLELDGDYQIAVDGLMLGGTFETPNALLIISRPLSSSEMAELREAGEPEIVPGLIWTALGTTFMGALILGFWFVRPLHQLRSATREMADGVAEPNLKKLPRRRDELGELAQTLRNTAIELAMSRDAQRRLLADVSHELRSPLARLQVALDLLGSEEIRGDRNYQQIDKDIHRLGSIIDSILWLSRLENGLDTLEPEQVDVGPIVQEIRSDLQFAKGGAETWSERLELPSDELPEVLSDAVLLRLVFENLIRNAFQYGAENKPVEVDYSTDATMLTVTIRDYGPGVAPEKLDQLFVPFYRADPSRHHGAGVGLGLALCLRAVSILNGAIRARNHPTGGLEVAVSLPLAAQRAATAELSEPKDTSR